MKKIFASLLTISTLLTGCGINQIKPEKTSLEIQAYQAKNFDADKKTVFNSAMSILQDSGYIIASASYETGFITAESPTKKDDLSSFSDFLFGTRSENKTSVTASIEEFGSKTTRVRLNFVSKSSKSSYYGQKTLDDNPIHDQAIYQTAFNKLSDAVFIRTSQK